MPNNESNIIIYNTPDGKASVALYTRDGKVWLNQKQIAELFGTSVPTINAHISKILKEGELDVNSVIRNYLTTASDGKQYDVIYYSLEMIIALGYRVQSEVAVRFSRWATQRLHEYIQKGVTYHHNGLPTQGLEPPPCRRIYRR